MMAPTTTVPKPSVSPMEKVAKFFAAVGEEASVRMEKAKSAYAAEVAWQLARRQCGAAAVSCSAALIAGLAVESETSECLILQEGLNVFGSDSIRIEEGRAEISGAQAGKSHFTNDTIALEGRLYVLKLFPRSRFASRTQLPLEAL